MKILKKISVKTVFGKLSVHDIPQGGELAVMSIVGRVVASDTITTDFGDSIRLKGDFRAVNSATGEMFASMQAYLPSDAANLIAATVRPGIPLEFAFKIGVKDNPDSVTGYEYVCEPIKVSDDNAPDPLVLLMERVSGVKALTAPKAGTAADARQDKPKDAAARRGKRK